MDKTTLDAWLCGPEDPTPSPAAMARALGLPADELSDTTLLRTADQVRSLRFILNVLRDIYPDDVDVRRWMHTPRVELDEKRPVDLLLAGRTVVIEDLVVRAWNDMPYIIVPS